MADYQDEIRSLKEENQKLKEELNHLKMSTTLRSKDYLIFDSSPTGIIIIGDNYIVEYVNKALADIFDLTREQLTGRDFRESLNSEYKGILGERYRRRREGEIIPEHYEFTTTTPAGQERFLELTSATMFDQYGKLKTIAQIVDISENKKANIALVESEEKYRNLIDNSPNGIVVSDLQGKFLTVNKKFLELTGFKSDEELQSSVQSVFDLIADEHKQLAWVNANNTLNGSLKGSLYYTLLRKDGSEFPAEISSVILNDYSGKPKTFLNICRDLTERQKAELELKESQTFLKNLFDAIQEGISVLDSELNVIMTNQWMESMYPDSLPLHGKKCYEVYHQSKEICEACPSRTTLNTGNTCVEIVPYTVKGEQKGWLEISTFPVTDDNGKLINIIEYVKDITEQENASRILKATTNKLSNIMRAANDGMWDWDLISGQVIFDPRYYQMAGYEQDEFPHLLSEFQKRVHPDDIDAVMNKAQMHLEGKIARFIVEFRFLRKDNSWMWILGRGIIVEWSDDGMPQRLLGTHTDISEMKEIQSELEKAKNKAEESDRLKSAFLANMSHEIRTPMNGILGFADLLTDDDLRKEELKEYVEIIKISGNRMLNTINDIIDISKIEARQTEIILSPGNINDHLASLHHFFMNEANQKGLSLAYTKSLPEQKAMVLTDHGKLISVLTNLLKNSLKFTREGEINFGYRLKQNHIEFFVSDTGIGISDDRLEAIFDRFVQADLTITKAYEGSGLGLSISKGFIELLGGDIWVESEVGKGSTFYFRLPYETDEAKDLEVSQIDNNFHKTRKMKNFTVLVVEDDESAGFYLIELLKNKFSRIILAKTGLEAVDICKKEEAIDLILMDIKLPDLDGFEATRRIRRFNQKVIIIGQTAYALVGDRKKVLEAGCDDYLSKPIDRNDLFSTINKHINYESKRTQS